MFSFDYVKDFDPEVAKAMEDELLSLIHIYSIRHGLLWKKGVAGTAYKALRD